MNWIEAKALIAANVHSGTDLNTPDSTYRFVHSVEVPLTSRAYDYHHDLGFVVWIGKATKIKIPWKMLERCHEPLSQGRPYDGAFFRQHFPHQTKDHPCHVHVVGQFFVAAGLAHMVGDSYLPTKGV